MPTCSNAAPHTRHCRGFTIIELMIVVVILVILIAIAGPDFRNIIISTRIKNASFDLFSTLTQARSEAVTRNTAVRICKAGASWAAGWTVTFATNCSTITAANSIRVQSAYDGVSITDTPTVSDISFTGVGRASSAVTFNIDAPNALAKSKRCVALDSSGRPRTLEGACP